MLNRGFAGVACCPAGVVELNKEPLPVAAEVVGVEPVPGAFPVLAPNRPEAGLALPPNRLPAGALGAVAPPVTGVEVPEALPNRPDDPPPGLLASPKRELPPVAGVDPVFPAPPNSPEEGVLAPPVPPNREPAGFCALLLFAPRPPNSPPPLDGLLGVWPPKLKPLEGVEDDAAPPKMFD